MKTQLQKLQKVVSLCGAPCHVRVLNEKQWRIRAKRGGLHSGTVACHLRRRGKVRCFIFLRKRSFSPDLSGDDVGIALLHEIGHHFCAPGVRHGPEFLRQLKTLTARLKLSRVHVKSLLATGLRSAKHDALERARNLALVRKMQAKCKHKRALEGAKYCPRCGVSFVVS